MSIRSLQRNLVARHNQLLRVKSNGQPLERSQVPRSRSVRAGPAVDFEFLSRRPETLSCERDQPATLGLIKTRNFACVPLSPEATENFFRPANACADEKQSAPLLLPCSQPSDNPLAASVRAPVPPLPATFSPAQPDPRAPPRAATQNVFSGKS